MSNIVSTYLDLLDSQREAAFATLNGLTEAQAWERPAAREWSIGEILNHNYLLIASTFPYVRLAWKSQHRRAEKHLDRPYQTEIDDPYHKPSFPMWVGFLWKPRHTPKNPVPLERILNENRELHSRVRDFYSNKNPTVLGNVFVYDPLFGAINLIVTLRIGIYHDQLHFDDVIKMAQSFRNAARNQDLKG